MMPPGTFPVEACSAPRAATPGYIRGNHRIVSYRSRQLKHIITIGVSPVLFKKQFSPRRARRKTRLISLFLYLRDLRVLRGKKDNAVVKNFNTDSPNMLQKGTAKKRGMSCIITTVESVNDHV
jgi:hypothetical protein